MSRLGFEMRNNMRDVRWELGLRTQDPARRPTVAVARPTYHWMRHKPPSHAAHGGWFVCGFVSDGGADVEQRRLDGPGSRARHILSAFNKFTPVCVPHDTPSSSTKPIKPMPLSTNPCFLLFTNIYSPRGLKCFTQFGLIL